jgi:hypothetical protein
MHIFDEQAAHVPHFVAALMTAEGIVQSRVLLNTLKFSTSVHVSARFRS